MTNKNAPRKMSAQAATNQGRRSFLVKSAAAGVCASLPAYGAEPARAASGVSCDVRSSPLDGLMTLKDSMYELQSAIYRQNFKEVGTHIEVAINYSAQLCDRVTALMAAMVAERKGAAEAQQMKALADIGCKGAEQMKGFSDAGQIQAQLSALNSVSEQIRLMASELLPEGKGVTLSVEATRILREIILIIDQQTVQAQKQLKGALEQSRRNANEFEGVTESIQARVSEAIMKMYEPKSAAAAAELVGKAGDELNKLLARLRPSSMQPEVKKLELLVRLAEGTRQWIAVQRADVGGSVVFRQASYRSAAATPVPVVAADELNALIYNFYPPEGYLKVGKCALLLTQLKVWAGLQSVTREEVAEMVGRGLDTYHITSREYQGREPQPDRFVHELTNIILS